MTRRSRREIERAVEDLATDAVDGGDATGSGFGTLIVYTDGDGYVTPDGDPVPTDGDGNPTAPDAGPHTTTIILDGRYAPRDAGATGAGT